MTDTPVLTRPPPALLAIIRYSLRLTAGNRRWRWMVLAAVGAVAYTVWSVIAVVKARGHRGRRVYSALLGAADGILTVYVLFCLMWGVNYWTDSFQDRSGITAQPVAARAPAATMAVAARPLTAMPRPGPT